MSARSRYLVQLGLKKYEGENQHGSEEEQLHKDESLKIEQERARYLEREKTPEPDEEHYLDAYCDAEDPFSSESLSDEYNPSSDNDSSHDSDDNSEVENLAPRSSISRHITAEDDFISQEKDVSGLSTEVLRDLQATTSDAKVIGKKKVFNLPEKISRKRKRRPETWTRNVSALARQQGKPYISQKSKKEMAEKNRNWDYYASTHAKRDAMRNSVRMTENKYSENFTS
ncbi:uncharacterized protein LOC116163690 [Photinus pyralis]|uniref:uncharacterized protein LOC116163690 n=1 Tax=Photinus pyralis TaxID=7054 RepID=UPI0012677A01|nr:uncharacterized protein LOC116163690 [Photinus pyralis]